MIRVHRVPHSTNVERVALAAAFKGLEVEWVDHPWEDRSGIEAVSGQPLAPVLEAGGAVIADSPRILAWLERQHPDPPLWPTERARRAEADVFVEWFNGVWKVAPNALAEPGRGSTGERAAWTAELRASRGRFEALLDGRDFLLGDGFGIADCVAFPFLKYGVLAGDPTDTDPFHAVLHAHLDAAEHPRLRDWVARCDALPRA